MRLRSKRGDPQPPDLGSSLDRQGECRYRARTAVRLAAGGKQALASLTSLPLAGHACIAAALRFTPPPRSPAANDHEVLTGSGRRRCLLPCHAAGCYRRLRVTWVTPLGLFTASIWNRSSTPSSPSQTPSPRPSTIGTTTICR